MQKAEFQVRLFFAIRTFAFISLHLFQLPLIEWRFGPSQGSINCARRYIYSLDRLIIPFIMSEIYIYFEVDLNLSKQTIFHSDLSREF